MSSPSSSAWEPSVKMYSVTRIAARPLISIRSMVGFDIETLSPRVSIGLQVTLRDRADDDHAVAVSDLGEGVGIGFALGKRGAQLVEVADHGRRGVEIQLAARLRPNSESVGHTRGDEDEGSGRAGVFLVVHEEEVIAGEHVEGFRGLAMDVHRRTEAWRLVRLEEGECVARLLGSGLDRHREVAEIDRAALAGSQDDRSQRISHSRSLPRTSVVGQF